MPRPYVIEGNIREKEGKWYRERVCVWESRAGVSVAERKRKKCMILLLEYSSLLNLFSTQGGGGSMGSSWIVPGATCRPGR